MQILDVINYINAALNYPSATIEDLRLFMNQAISEINTTFHILIPTINKMQKTNEDNISGLENLVLLPKVPDSTTTIPVDDNSKDYYYSASENAFYLKIKNEFIKFSDLYAIYNDYSGDIQFYKAVILNSNLVVWYRDTSKDNYNFDLEEYLTRDWIMLFFIPYICYKYSVRDGDQGALFVDEFTQGFQQLQNTYSIPETQVLKRVCHKLPYKQDVLNNIDNLNIEVSTKAITEDMIIPRALNATFAKDFYSRGGWL